MSPPHPPPRPTLRPVEERFVRAADEDDDRFLHAPGSEGRVAVNPHFERTKGWGWGWHPPYTRRLDTREPVHPDEATATWADYAGTAGYFRATLSERRDLWRVSCWGADDTGYERDGLSERRARVLWAQLRDHVTIRTLKRLGFVPA